MKKVGGGAAEFASYNTCRLAGRVLRFFPRFQRLFVAEIALGENAVRAEADTGVECGVTLDCSVSCCALGSGVLVLAGEREGSFAALVDVGEPRAAELAVNVTKLDVSGSIPWSNWPFLCQISGDRALLYFHDRSRVWECEVRAGTLVVTDLRSPLPTRYGFGSAAVHVSDGKLLVAGAYPYTKQVTFILLGEALGFEAAGIIPGVARNATSLVLIRKRFVAGFGGLHGGLLDDLWLLDLQTGQSSAVRRGGTWHLADQWVPLAEGEDALYLVGGQWDPSVYSLPFSALASLIVAEGLREAFSEALGLPRRDPAMLFGRSQVGVISGRL